MGFCRRCGEIASGTRCKCGGTAVAPVVPWSRSQLEERTPDRWSKTYIHRERSASPTRPTTNLSGSVLPAPAASPTKRFPRPTANSDVSTPVLGSRVSAHIASATSRNRPPSPLKYSSTLPDPDSDILPSLVSHDVTLSKVYGSVLQPKESLATHSCAICSSIFPPDATIYPDPTAMNSSQFLCRPCFITNGGSRGPCHVCSRPVLILKSEGGFVEAAEKYWHKRCFNCSGCSKNIGDSPILDLFGNPSCAECFDNCLTRTPKKRSQGDGKVNHVNNIGGMNFNSSSSRSRERSPAVEELEQRLGIVESREGSPALEELSQRLGMIGKESSARYSASGSLIGRPPASNASHENNPLAKRSRSKRNSRLDQSPARKYSPIRGQTTGSPAPTQEAIEEMKQRFLKESPDSSSKTLTFTHRTDPSSLIGLSSSMPSRAKSSIAVASPLLDTAPTTRLSPIIPQTPDLISDLSDTTTQSSSSGPGSPPRNAEDFNELFCPPEPDSTRYLWEEQKTLQSPDELIPPSTALVTTTFCADCGGPLFSVRDGGKYFSVPNDGTNAQTLMYHTDCFKCVECHRVFKQGNNGQTIFVTSRNGPCHVECAPATKITFRMSPTLSSLTSSPSDGTTKSTAHAAALPPSSLTYAPSSRLERQPLVTPTSAGTLVPRFGSRTTCPGCHQSVSPMERGVVPGPQGTRWHARCLVCGSKKGGFEQAKGKNIGEPGCGKRLDSAAKSSEDGGVWCRDCLLLLGEARIVSSQMSVVPAHTSFAKVTTQFSGTTTIARQFTGMGGDSGLLRQMTGGGLSPTRSISPTKQLGMLGMRPRPKSVIGMRNTKSIDEGRGMFLVRQLTGASGV